MFSIYHTWNNTTSFATLSPSSLIHVPNKLLEEYNRMVPLRVPAQSVANTAYSFSLTFLKVLRGQKRVRYFAAQLQEWVVNSFNTLLSKNAGRPEGRVESHCQGLESDTATLKLCDLGKLFHLSCLAFLLFKIMKLLIELIGSLWEFNVLMKSLDHTWLIVNSLYINAQK